MLTSFHKIFICCCLLTLCLSWSYSQEGNLDQLKEQLTTSEGLARFDILYQMGELEREDRRYKRAARYTEDALEIARRLDNLDAELNALELLASIYQRDNRQRKFVETELEYRKLKGKIDQQLLSQEVNTLQSELDSLDGELSLSEQQKLQLQVEKEGIMDEKEDILSEKNTIANRLELTREEKLLKERELERVRRKRAELEKKAQELENEALRNQMAVQAKEIEISRYEARVQQQRLAQSLTAALLVLVALVAIFLWYALRERRRRTEERISMQKQLLMQEKLASLGQLTAGIAHEIKNPLNFVNNFAEGSAELSEELAELLEGREKEMSSEYYEDLKELTTELKQNASDILSNGHRMDRIVHGMMEHARGEKGVAQPADINLLIEDAINLAYHGFRAIEPEFNITIEKRFESFIPKIELVSQDISRVFLNLFNNACHALHQKQQTNTQEYEPILRITTRYEKEGVTIEVWDNGPGIPTDIRDKIFTPFFTTKPTGQGNIGLGLSISHDIVVEGHAGELKFDSIPGEYACFLVFLPRYSKTSKERKKSKPVSV